MSDIFDFFAQVFPSETNELLRLGVRPTPVSTRKEIMSKTNLSGTPHKRKRRTQAELETLDAHLYRLVRDNRPCTVRQIYYRAVVHYLCDKDERGYNLIQRRLLHLRRAGVLPYGWIEDNARMFYGGNRYSDPQQFMLDAARYSYHLDYWQNEPINVEIWCESDSIAGTLRHTVTQEWGLRLYVARGFSSETYVYNAGDAIKEDKRETFIYILSDFDPSGVTLAEDIAAKLAAFADPVPVHVERIALSGEQVERWDLPTHPLKKSDGRAKRFRLEHGHEACELEAVPPNDLRTLLSNSVARHVDPSKIEAAKREEKLQREVMASIPSYLWER